MAKFLKSQDFKTTFKHYLTCIFYLSELIQKIQFAITDPVDVAHWIYTSTPKYSSKPKWNFEKFYELPSLIRNVAPGKKYKK